MARLKDDDIGLLLVPFQAPVRSVRDALRGLGYDVCVRDTRRTAAEALANAKAGTGSRQSMHVYDAAVDFVCQEHHWSCAKHGCRFFQNVGRLGKAHGMIWGGDFRRVDMPHLQCVRIEDQGRFRRMTREQRSLYVARFFTRQGVL